MSRDFEAAAFPEKLVFPSCRTQPGVHLKGIRKKGSRGKIAAFHATLRHALLFPVRKPRRSKKPSVYPPRSAQAAGHTILDLVKGNVNEHGMLFPQEVLREILREASDQARIYKPDSLGQTEAREAISAYYEHRIPASQIVVTPGTSVSYWYCFKLLAEQGDEILTPQPLLSPLRLHCPALWRHFDKL